MVVKDPKGGTGRSHSGCKHAEYYQKSTTVGQVIHVGHVITDKHSHSETQVGR